MFDITSDAQYIVVASISFLSIALFVFLLGVKDVIAGRKIIDYTFARQAKHEAELYEELDRTLDSPLWDEDAIAEAMRIANS